MPALLRRHLAVLALTLAALPAAADDHVRIDSAFNAAAMAPALLKAQSDGNKTVRGIGRVAIGAFDIEFATKGSPSESATWMSHASFDSGRDNPSVTMALAGIRDTDLQAIVDQVHAAFERDLRLAGMDVVPLAQLRQAGAFRKLASASPPAPFKKSGTHETATVFTAQERPVTGASLVARGAAGSAPGAYSAIASSMASGPELARDLDATVINVRMVVRFVEQSNPGSSLFSRVSGSATAESKIIPAVVAGETRVHIFAANGGGAFTLQKPLHMASTAFSGVKDLMSPGSKASGVGLAVLSFAIGKADRNPINQFEAVADGQRYRELVGHGLGQVGSMMVEQLKTLR